MIGITPAPYSSSAISTGSMSVGGVSTRSGAPSEIWRARAPRMRARSNRVKSSERICVPAARPRPTGWDVDGDIVAKAKGSAHLRVAIYPLLERMGRAKTRDGALSVAGNVLEELRDLAEELSRLLEHWVVAAPGQDSEMCGADPVRHVDRRVQEIVVPADEHEHREEDL